MKALLKEIRHNPLLWLLVFVPVVLAAAKFKPEAHTFHGDELLFERGMIATNLPLAELKQRSHLNARARAADKEADFSHLIREGVPGITP
jgi:Ca2+:H+ antiporter